MDAGVATLTRAPALALRREALGQYFFEAAHCRRALVGQEPAGAVPSVPIVARREHRIADGDVVDRPAAAVQAEEGVSRPHFREARPRLFQVDRQRADRRNLQPLDVARMTGL